MRERARGTKHERQRQKECRRVAMSSSTDCSTFWYGFLLNQCHGGGEMEDRLQLTRQEGCHQRQGVLAMWCRTMARLPFQLQFQPRKSFLCNLQRVQRQALARRSCSTRTRKKAGQSHFSNKQMIAKKTKNAESEHVCTAPLAHALPRCRCHARCTVPASDTKARGILWFWCSLFTRQSTM